MENVTNEKNEINREKEALSRLLDYVEGVGMQLRFICRSLEIMGDPDGKVDLDDLDVVRGVYPIIEALSGNIQATYEFYNSDYR